MSQGVKTISGTNLLPRKDDIEKRFLVLNHQGNSKELCLMHFTIIWQILHCLLITLNNLINIRLITLGYTEYYFDLWTSSMLIFAILFYMKKHIESVTNNIGEGKETMRRIYVEIILFLIVICFEFLKYSTGYGFIRNIIKLREINSTH